MNLMKSSLNRSYVVILCLLFSLISCKGINRGGTAANATTDGTDTAPLYLGHWLSDCVDLGGGLVNRIYQEINSDKTIKLAILAYPNTNCTGVHVLKNQNGDAITEPEYAQDYAEDVVTDIPDNFYVLQIANVGSLSSQYAVVYVNDHDFYELTGFTNPHDSWNSWQGEADVSQYAMNPTTYDPSTATKYHFTKSELP